MNNITINQVKSAWEYANDANYGDSEKLPILRAYIDVSLPNALAVFDTALKNSSSAVIRTAGGYGVSIAKDGVERESSSDSRLQLIGCDKTNKENASMDEKDEVKETPEEEKKELPEKEEKKGDDADMKAEYETMKASLAEVTAKLEAANQEKATMETELQTVKAQLVEVNNKVVAHEVSLKAFKVNELKSRLVGSVMDEEEFVAKQETLLGLPEDAIELMTRNKKENKSSDGRLNMAANDHTEDTVTVKLYRS